MEKFMIGTIKFRVDNSKPAKQKFFEKLSNQFDRQGYLKVAEELGIGIKAAEKYISQFKPGLFQHERNQYPKIFFIKHH